MTLPLSPPARGGPDNIAELFQGLGQAVAYRRRLENRGGGMGRHFSGFGDIEVFRFDHHEAADAHVADGPGGGSDIFREAGPLEDDGDVVQIYF